jgi:hypothetical protein
VGGQDVEGGAGGAHGSGEVAGQVVEYGGEDAVGDAEVEGGMTEGLGPYRKVGEMVRSVGKGKPESDAESGGDEAMVCDMGERLSGGDQSTIRGFKDFLQADERNGEV